MTAAVIETRAVTHDEFYASLAPDIAQELQQHEDNITMIQNVIQSSMAQIVDELIEAKKIIQHGQFMDWVSFTLPNLSLSTIEKLMQTRENMPQALEENMQGMFQTRAMYLLAANNTPEDRRDLAVELAAKGVYISEDLAKVLKYADSGTLDRVRAGELSASQGAELIAALQLADPQIALYCIEQKVTYPEMVTYLDEAYRQRGTRSAWGDIETAGGYLQEGDFAKHISKANESDIERYTDLRRQMHYENAKAEKAQREMEDYDIEEIIKEDYPPGGIRQLIDAWLAVTKEGSKIFIHMIIKTPKDKQHD